jgi:DNA-binding PadR family transcriptional regulator
MNSLAHMGHASLKKGCWMTTQRKLTELEGCVLGLIWAKGPCTPYTVRREFLASPSPHWSGSAGAIYPLIDRLEKRKLLRSAEHADGLRMSKRYEMTASGVRKLRAWAGPPLSRELLGVPADPLRTRLRFLEALSLEQQVVFIAEAERGLVEQIQLVEADYESRASEGRMAQLMARGALLAMEARLKWIRKVGLALVAGQNEAQQLDP